MFEQFIPKDQLSVLKNAYGNKRSIANKNNEAFLWDDFDHFLSTVTNRPSATHRFTKIDPTKPWGPDNWQWEFFGKGLDVASYKTPSLVMIKFAGQIKPLRIWAKELEFNYHTLYYRIFKSNWSVEKAFTTPIR